MRYAIAAIMLGIATSANAGFISNYSEWRSLSDSGRLFYVLGLYDSEDASQTVGEPTWITARRSGTRKCAAALKLSGDMMVEAVNAHYTRYNRDWGISPSVIYIHVMRNICLDHINASLVEAGLKGDWKPFEGGMMP